MSDRTAAQELHDVVRFGDVLPEWARGLIGRSAQLRVPLRDPISLRRVATVLRTLADRLETLSHSRDTAQHVMLSAYSAVREAQGRLSRPTSSTTRK